MGSSSSHLVPSESTSSRKSSGPGGSFLSRTKLKLSRIFCGVFCPKSTFQKVEDFPEISSIACTKILAPVDNPPQYSVLESSSVFTLEAGDIASTDENRDSSGRSSIIEETILKSSPSNVQTSRDVEPLQFQPSQESVSGNATQCVAEVIVTHDAISEGTVSTDPGHDQLASLAQGPSVSDVQSDDLDHSQNAVVGHNSSDLRSLSIVSDFLSQFQFPGDDHAHMTTTSSSGFLVSDTDQDLRIGDLLRLDLVSMSLNSLSGNIAEANSDESRRNSLRLFWDALSRRSLRRHSDYQIIIFATGISGDVGSHDRWLLDFSSDLHHYGADRDLDSFGSRLHRRNERRWLLRSEEDETALCASGLHLDGTCSCDSFFTAEESRNLDSISRIILLAEALFEVLDEIHLQSLSLSLSTLSLPAPEAVVDAFPLKYYKRTKNAGSNSSDVQQCHVCLCDYEEGDELHVLPCNHEFHVPCIDKWLKEVNRVCPLCRHDVCEGREE